MKKISLLILGAILLSFSPLRGDEGMWLLPLIEKLNSKKMSELGFKLTAKDIYDINNSSLKDAVISFGGGCTGEIISKEGLLLTNHHCGYGSIQKLSTVEHDYLQDGYWAMNREQELPSPGLTVTFLENIIDVTKDVENAVAKATTPEESAKALAAVSDELIAKAIAGNKFLKGRVASFFGGNTYLMMITKTYTDIRFVGAPPSSIGKFGADTDNWMWPRHTGDFSMFRVYADKDNNPADYSKDNIPYQPKKHLTISLKGVEQKDFAMIIGYPGRTNRFMTSAEVKEMSDITNSISIYVRGIRQDVLMKDMVADPKIRLQYASKYSGSSNFWKKAIGMNETFAKLGVQERRAEEERTFTKWVNEDKARIEKYGTALNDINSSIAKRAEALTLSSYTREALNNIEVFSVASAFAAYADAISKGETDRAKQTLAMAKRRTESFYKDYSPATDKKVAKALLNVYRDKVKAADRPDVFKTIDTQFGGNIDAYVDFIFEKSVFVSQEKFKAALNGNIDALLSDPALAAAKSINVVMGKTFGELQAVGTTLAKGQKAYIAGLLEMKKGQAMYPDANSTMRLSYGQVLNYSPKDAVLFEHVTTLKGVMEKEDPNNWEFVVPAKLKELYKAKDYGQYAMKNGEMPVAFLTNNDITGGNSGSPVLNAKGELIGTAFDGNWEAMSGDIIFEPSLQRTISVDIRYTLFIMDKFGGAGYLLKEMTIAK
ncbi:MAG: S46 family peptidase [Bacteroidales bacterium]|nr:S46 family peptidase [Bacteroidales bacterium]HNW48114.1 S46 family peptidase [Bacteroidales bacterium]HPS95203.1 S46 family peptidase [Bacteroidales bacterium]